VTYPEFFVRISFVWLILTGMAFWWKKQQWLRPAEAKVISWEGTLFLFARWPWSFIGTVAALRDWICGNTLDFRVTPKGRDVARPLPTRVLAPYAFLSIASGLPVLLLAHVKIAIGFYVFATVNSLFYAFLLVVILCKHRRENSGAFAVVRPDFLGYRTIVAGLVMVTIAIPTIALPLRIPTAINWLLWGHERVLDREVWKEGIPELAHILSTRTASAKPHFRASPR
jgi:cellulose synthase (UDP-forming)